jgi:hypothetical protein
MTSETLDASAGVNLSTFVRRAVTSLLFQSAPQKGTGETS